MRNAVEVTAVALAALAVGVVGLGAQTVTAGPLELDLSGRAQVQFNTTTVNGEDLGITDGTEPAATAFETRRIRFGTKFAYEGWLTGIVEADFGGGGARLTDGYIDAQLVPGFGVRAGQFKKPFGLIELTSSTQIRTIERSVRIRGLEELVAGVGDVIGEEQYLLDAGMYVGRQVGVMAHGALGPLGYYAGVFNGEGANAGDERSSKAFAGRLTLGLAEALTVGGGVSVQPTGSFDASGSEESGTAYVVEAQYGDFRRSGPTIMAEFMTGDNWIADPGPDGPTMMGVQGVAAWFVPTIGARVEGVEPVVRVSWGDPDRDVTGDAGTTVTPGLNLYFTGRNRFMVNGEVYLPSQEELETEYALVAQLQVYF